MVRHIAGDVTGLRYWAGWWPQL